MPRLFNNGAKRIQPASIGVASRPLTSHKWLANVEEEMATFGHGSGHFKQCENGIEQMTSQRPGQNRQANNTRQQPIG